MVINIYHVSGTLSCSLHTLFHKEGIIIILTILEMEKMRCEKKFNLFNNVALK